MDHYNLMSQAGLTPPTTRLEPSQLQEIANNPAFQ
jgi:hypothetical protein